MSKCEDMSLTCTSNSGIYKKIRRVRCTDIIQFEYGKDS